MSRILLLFLLSFATRTAAQVGIGTSNPDASAKLHVEAGNKGFLPPRVALTSTTDVITIASPAAGLLVYNTSNTGSSPGNVTPGYYYYNGASWSRLSTAASLDGLSDAKSGGTDFSNSLLIGSRSTGTLSAASGNTGVGIGVFNSLTSGDINTAVGWDALRSLTTGSINSAFGYHALRANTTGSDNTAIGSEAMKSNTVGARNTALGSQCLYNNTSGIENTAVGVSSMYNATGSYNTAVGNWSLYAAGTGSRNVAIGYDALWSAYQGNDNVAVGYTSLASSTGSNNSSMGSNSLYRNSTGANNAATGFNALYANTTGASNAAFGKGALYTNTTGSNNTAIGTDADVTAVDLTNTTAIGYNAKVSASNTIQLGNTSVTSINTSASVNAAAFNVSSDARLKDNIQSLDYGLETVMRLKPYRYEKRRQEQSNAQGSPEYGFIAQDVSDILPELVGRSNDPDGTLNLNYTALIPILARAIQEQQQTIAELRIRLQTLDGSGRPRDRKGPGSRKRN